MVSSVLAEAILNQKAPDILGSFDRGRERSLAVQTKKLTSLALKEGGGDALAKLRDINPEAFLALGEHLQAESVKDISDFIRDAQIGENFLQAGDTQGFLAFADQRSNTLRNQGRDSTQTDQIAELVRSGQSELALIQLRAFSDSISQASLTAGQRERGDLQKDLQSAIDPITGKLKPTKDLTATERSAAIALRLLSPAGATTVVERIADDPGLTERVASSQSKIRSAIKQAESIAKARGETITDLARAEAALPGLIEVVGKLKVLADEATFTLAGKGFNAIAKQFGFSTKGDTSKAMMVSIVDNQVLPLLKPIFGSAFTAAEGDRLRNAFLDPNSTPESRKAQLDSFLEQMQRNIETKKLELGGQQAPQQRQGGQLMIDAQGNRAMVFPDGTFEEIQ